MSQPPIAQLERHVEDLEREVQRLREALEASRAAEAAAMHEARQWQQLFYALPDFVSVIDREHHFVHVNQRMADRMGVTIEEAVGKPCYELIHASGAPPAFCPHALAMHDGRPHAAEIYEPTLSAFFLVTASPLTDVDGRVVATVHVIRELPDRTMGTTEMAATHAPATLEQV